MTATSTQQKLADAATARYAANLRFVATVRDANNEINVTLICFSRGLATEDELVNAFEIWQNAVNTAREILG